MLPPQELNSLLEDTAPQVMEKHPSSKNEVSTAPSCFVVGGTPADALPARSPDSRTISSTCSADLESITHQESRTDSSSAVQRLGEGMAKEDDSASVTEDEVRVVATVVACCLVRLSCRWFCRIGYYFLLVVRRAPRWFNFVATDASGTHRYTSAALPCACNHPRHTP